MSRSRKKVSCFSDYSRKYTRWSKRQASKKVRRYKNEISNGNLYKKIYPTWDIFDYKFTPWYDNGDPIWGGDWYQKGFRK